MLSVVTWKWRPFEGYRSTYGPETVNTLRSMVRRHYPDPHRFICITDDAIGLDPDIHVVPIWNDFAELKHPTNPMQPSCYRRLRAFAPEMKDILGPRFVSMDLDCVVLDDLRPLWNRPEPFVGWSGALKSTPYNGSMWLMTAGARAHVWKDFNPLHSPRLARQAGHYGSDQAWISFCLGPKEPTWSTRDGVYSFRVHVEPKQGVAPANARVIFFNGKLDPWSPGAQRLDWVQAHWN